MERFPRIETARLILKEITLNDVDFYFHHFNNSKIVEGCCFPGPKDLEAAREELERYCVSLFRENRGVRWGITMKGDVKLIGTCGFYNWVKQAKRAEIGYDLDPAWWGRGIMTEALDAVLGYGFESFELNRIQAIVDSKNVRSLELVRRLGFEKEGVLRQRSYFSGQFRDDVCFSMLKKEWKTK